MNDCVKIWCSNIYERRMVTLSFENIHFLDVNFINRIYSAPMGFIIEGNKLKQTKSQAIFNKCKYERITAKEYALNTTTVKIGDIVKVINPGSTYSAYYEWHGLKDYKKDFVLHDAPNRNDTYKVVNIDFHSECSSSMSALIQDIKTKQVYIIAIYSIKKVE